MIYHSTCNSRLFTNNKHIFQILNIKKAHCGALSSLNHQVQLEFIYYVLCFTHLSNPKQGENGACMNVQWHLNKLWSSMTDDI